jgi:glycosyltransferase involved in cell wall biosynthesis
MTRVCFFGAFDPAYPRHRILRAGLEACGMATCEARVRETRAFRRWPALARAFARVRGGADVVLVPEFRHKDVPLAAALRGRRPLVFDPLVSRWDTLVEDWKLHRPGSAQARWNRAIDRWSLSAADLVLCDTWAHGELFVSLGARRDRLRRVLVGAEDAFFDVPPPPAEGPVRILYVGGFLPLHGVGTILEAARRLRERGAALPAWTLVMAGSGIEYESARATAAGWDGVEFAGRTPYADAPALLARSHIALGAFGAGEKAGRVIPHKLWQGLAAGRAVVTGDGDGPREVFEDGAHLRLVPRADAAALAEALAGLVADASLRVALGTAGAARARELGSARAVGATLAAAIREVAA